MKCRYDVSCYGRFYAKVRNFVKNKAFLSIPIIYYEFEAVYDK